MRAVIVSVVAAVGLMICGCTLAADMPAVGKAKCGACHAIEKKVIGPAWMDVSKKYKGDPEAANKIVMNVIGGGTFGWNTGTKMPARGLGANDAEIQKLATFITGLSNQ